MLRVTEVTQVTQEFPHTLCHPRVTVPHPEVTVPSLGPVPKGFATLEMWLAAKLGQPADLAS